jgi:uncharacterized protein (DUF736 family)
MWYMRQDEFHQQQLEQQQQENKMSTYEQKAGTISMFTTDKEGNEKRPDFSGNMVTEGGEKLQVSLWWSESQKGTKYLSGKVQAPYQGGGSGGGSHSSGGATDVPF